MQVDSNKRPRFDPAEYELRKRLPPQLPRGNNHIYISNRTDFNFQLARARTLIINNEPEIIHIHGIGAAINRAINLAVQLEKEFSDKLESDVHTSTIDLIDDLEPLNDEGLPMTQTRQTSTVDIKLLRKRV